MKEHRMFELKPMNKYVVIDPVKEDERVGREGILVAPGNALAKQHRMARIVAKDECEEAKHLSIGDLVFYDHIGAVEGRVGMQGFTVIKAIAVLAVVRQKETVVAYDPSTMEPKRVLPDGVRIEPSPHIALKEPETFAELAVQAFNGVR